MLRRGTLDWERDSANWPLRDHSEFVAAASLNWHLQRMGRGPTLLLIHGTAASSHSWRDLMPILADRFSVVAVDLPGHGFTSMPPRHRLSLNGMASALGALLSSLDLSPTVVVGHSAGAAIAARMCLEDKIAPDLLVSLNGAWLPFPGSSGLLFPLLARALFLNPVTPRFFAAMADKAAVERLIRQTGSRLPPEGVALYQRLLRSSRHCAGALGMMANWDLVPLNRSLPELRQKLLLIVGDSDLAVPPSSAEKIRGLVERAEVQRLADLGHLAHEEDPERVAAMILQAAEATAKRPAST